MKFLGHFLIILTVGLLTLCLPTQPWSPESGFALADDDDDDDEDDDDDDDDDRPRTRADLVVIGLSPSDRQRLTRNGFRIASQGQSGTLGSSIARVQGPPGRSLTASLRTIRSIARGAQAAPNSIYQRFAYQRYDTEGEACRTQCAAFNITEWIPDIGNCSVGSDIGVIDTRVDLKHPSLVGAKIVTKTLRRSDRAPSHDAHGTGVVSLLAGRHGSSVTGIVPNARIFAADAFHRVGNLDQADTFDLVAALDWLSESKVSVINMSLSGPPNPILEKSIANILQRGISIVAASGKPSRNSSSGYPARYKGVVAVSAVDSNLRASRLSNRGDYVAFAAPGVGISVASDKGGTATVDGTSFASPFVAAAIALRIASGDTPTVATEKLASSAKDLGSVGRDPIFGWGLIRFQGLPNCN
ncbi:MAG: hypothetical protein CTY31_04305 [Hyphomicrobium sp.]|nr:MAG: hypothetical protein CTY39_02925 [Hyphomicrobium sp.]PPD00374.1 MAG: hypothetical protein CTY31_04305 [Hyphomicrobium sp.]